MAFATVGMRNAWNMAAMSSVSCEIDAYVLASLVANAAVGLMVRPLADEEDDDDDVSMALGKAAALAALMLNTK